MQDYLTGEEAKTSDDWWHKYIDSPSTGEHLSGEAAIKAAEDLGGILDWPPLPATDPTIVH